MSSPTPPFEIHIHGDVPLRAEVKFDQIQEALKPIWKYAGARSLADGARSSYEDEPGIKFDAPQNLLQMCWTVAGDEDFRQTLDEMCMNLNELAQTGAAIEVSFYDTEFDEEEEDQWAESRDDFTMLFVGPTPSAIMQVQRDLLVQDVVGMMERHFDGSELSGVVPLERIKNFPDPGRILAEFKPDGVRRVIAARVRGDLVSAFKEAPPPPADAPGAPKEKITLPEHRAKTEGAANMVVVADSDMLGDRFWVRVQEFFGQQEATPFSDNGPFVANLIGTLAGGDALIGLRSRGTSLRPFDLVEDMQRTAEARFRATEQELTKHLDETQKKLTELRTGRGAQAANAVISEQQRETIDALRRDITDTRGKLRTVQLELRRDIRSLENQLRMFNIVLVPAVLALIAIVLGIARRQRRARARA